MNIFGGDLSQFGKDAFGQLFGIMDTKDTKSINQPTTGNWTKDRARTMQGGQEPTGFWAPPPVSDFRSEGIHKDRPSTGNEILTFWINVPGEVKVGQSFEYGPWANYGTVEKTMMWDVNGYAIGGYTKTTREKVKVIDKHKQVIEKWDPELGVWNKISERDTTTGSASFSQQGYYRITVALYHTAFRLGPQYGTVRVIDPAYNRKGSEIYYEIMAKLPPPYSGLGMTISGRGKPQKQFSQSEGFRPDCGSYSIGAQARKGIVEFEDNASRMMKSQSSPEDYKYASWILRDKGGSMLYKSDERESFFFDANYWGDGEFILETHLAKIHQGQGVQNMPVQPAVTYITVHDCGKGRFTPPADEKKTFEGDVEKKTIDVPDIDPNKFVKLDGNNMKQVPGVPLFDVVNHELPKDTPDVPVELSRDCNILQRQISHRTRQLQIPCDEPVLLMEQLIKTPKRYDDMEKDMAKEWDAALTKIQAFRSPFTKPAEEYAKLIIEAYREGLVVSAEDMKKYRPTDKFGNPSIIGHGIPQGFFVFDKKKIDIANRLRQEQKRIYEEWASLRREAEKRLLELKKEIDATNKRLEDYHRALMEIRADLNKIQTKLSDMYNSGKYEHCLGFGGTRTSDDYAIQTMDGKKEFGAQWGLPGMNIRLPEPKKRSLEVSTLSVPKPLHEIQPLKIKGDGIKQVEMDRKLMESLAEAKRLQYEAEYGSWSNWVGSKLMWLGELANDVATYVPPFTAMSYATSFINNLKSGMTMDQAMNAAYKDSFGAMAEGYGKLGQWSYDFLFSKSYSEKKETIASGVIFAVELVPKIFEGLGNDVAKYIQANNDILKEIERDMDELNNLHKYGDSPEANTQRLAIYKRQLDNWQKMEEAGNAMDNLILTAATSNTALQIAKYAGAEVNVVLNGLKEFLKDSMVQAKNIGFAVGQSATLSSRAAYLDDMVRAGNIVSGSADDAVRLARETSRSAAGQLDDALRAQMESAKKLADKLDEVIEKNQARIRELDPPSRWEPIKNVEINKDTLANKQVLGQGAAGRVIDLGDNKVAKVFVKHDEALAAAAMQDELKGLKILREADIPHVKCEGAGHVVEDFLGEVKKQPVLVKQKFTQAQKTLDEIANTRKLTRLEQIEALQFYDDAAKKGIVFGDPNPGNLLKEVLPDGTSRYLAVEGGSIGKITDPQSARKFMAAMFTEEVGEVASHANQAILNRMNKLGEMLDNIGAPKSLRDLADNFVEKGFSLSDNNLAKHIDKDLLEAFKDQAKWEKLVKDARKADALTNKGRILDNARVEIEAAQRAVEVQNQTVRNTLQQITEKTNRIEGVIAKEIDFVPNIGVIKQQTERLEEELKKGDKVNIKPFDEISFVDYRWFYENGFALAA